MLTKLAVLLGTNIILCTFLIRCEAKLRMVYHNEHDALFVARCEAKCWKMENNKACLKGCLSKPSKKPGSCPQNITTMSPFVTVCLDSCKVDSQCPGLEKCCRHSCGITCQDPEDLDNAVGLPVIPKDLTVTERRKRTVYIQWSPSKYENTIFLIEQRHHTGKHFAQSKLSKWVPVTRTTTNKPSCLLRKTVKPGNWYQFRVAAVNENGTKGYSESSLPFSISVSPKPPKEPLNLTVGPVFQSKSKSLYVELRWSEPQSDLPIIRYKVFWSIRLHGIKALNSVLVRHQVVPKEQTYFLLQNLTADSLYFLQVQAISQYGNQRLKSEKSNLALNTSTFANVTDIFPRHTIESNSFQRARIEELHLQKLFWINGDLRARIKWKSQNGSPKFAVTWWQSRYCNTEGVDSDFSHSKLFAITNVSQYELHDIKFNCRYRVTVREISPKGKKSHEDTSVTFETPSCRTFRNTQKKIKCFEL